MHKGTIRGIAIAIAVALALNLVWELAAWALLGYPVYYLGLLFG